MTGPGYIECPDCSTMLELRPAHPTTGAAFFECQCGFSVWLRQLDTPTPRATIRVPVWAYVETDLTLEQWERMDLDEREMTFRVTMAKADPFALNLGDADWYGMEWVGDDSPMPYQSEHGPQS